MQTGLKQILVLSMLLLGLPLLGVVLKDMPITPYLEFPPCTRLVQHAAKWIYSVPLVNDFQIFEMPVAGFSGYLPFGIECLVIALLLKGIRTRSA